MRYHCPVLRCRWHYDDADGIVSNEMPEELASLFNVSSVPAGQDRTERALEDHLATHRPRDFVETIATLRDQVARLGGDPTENRHASAGRHLSAPFQLPN